MTDFKEKLYVEAQRMEDEFGKATDRPGNLRFTVLHTDGVLSSFHSYVCWGPLRAIIQSTPQAREHGRAYCADGGYCESTADIDKILINFWGSRESECGPSNRKYAEAVHAWCGLYNIGLVEASPEEREEHGIIVDVSGGRLTLNQLGAFLVGFRNLSEQKRYHLFHSMLEAGIAVHRAAFLNQLYRAGETEMLASTGSHTIFGATYMYRPSERAVINQIDDNPWFMPEDDQPVRAHEGSLVWEFTPRWNTRWDNGYDGFTASLNLTQHRKGLPSSWASYTYWDKTELIAKLKERFHG